MCKINVAKDHYKHYCIGHFWQCSVHCAETFWQSLHQHSRITMVIVVFQIKYDKTMSGTHTSVRQLLVPLMVTLLWLSMVAQMLIASPGT